MRRPRRALRTALICIGVMLVGACTGGSGSFAVPNGRILFEDDFEGEALDSSWAFTGADEGLFSLTDQPGFLRLSAKELTGGSSAPSQVLREVSGDFLVQTKLEFDPGADRQLAGLVIEGRDGRTVTFGIISARFPRDTFRGLSGVAEQAGGADPETGFEAFKPDEVYLLIQRKGDVFSLAYSTDGREFTPLADLNADLSEDVQVGLGNAVRENCETRCNDPSPAFFDFVEILRPR
ncbi:MAG: hypothetical protein ACE5GE_14625 [Phycisphaerae bacterium]